MLMTDSPEFYRIAKALRAMPSQIRHMCLYAAEFYSDEQILGNDGLLAPVESKPAPKLKLVSKGD